MVQIIELFRVEKSQKFSQRNILINKISFLWQLITCFVFLLYNEHTIRFRFTILSCRDCRVHEIEPKHIWRCKCNQTLGLKVCTMYINVKNEVKTTFLKEKKQHLNNKQIHWLEGTKAIQWRIENLGKKKYFLKITKNIFVCVDIITIITNYICSLWRLSLIKFTIYISYISMGV